MSTQTRPGPALDTPTPTIHEGQPDPTDSVLGTDDAADGPVVLHFTPEPVDVDMAAMLGVEVGTFCGIRLVPRRPMPADAVVCLTCHRATIAHLQGRAAALVDLARGGHS